MRILTQSRQGAKTQGFLRVVSKKMFLNFFNFATLRLCDFALKLSLAFVFVGFLSLTAFAASLADYKERIESARYSADELFQNLDNADADLEREIIAEIEKGIPATEKIEWKGGDVETDNQWLGARLREFSAEPNRSNRGAILTGISERLLAVSETVGDLDAAIASTQTKDQDKQKLAEILRREEYQKRQVKEESLFQKWWREFLEWLAKIFPNPEITPGVESGAGSIRFGLQIFIYALFIGLAGFLIYRFAPFFKRRFGRKSKKAKHDRVILGERIGRDESAADLFSEAERMARDGNLRGAIRKGYIALLCDLSDRKIVRLARHKTNRDYLRDVRKDNDLFENMSGLTRNFESNWYGLRAAEQADWEDFRSLYKQTLGFAGSSRER